MTPKQSRQVAVMQAARDFIDEMRLETYSVADEYDDLFRNSEDFGASPHRDPTSPA